MTVPVSVCECRHGSWPAHMKHITTLNELGTHGAPARPSSRASHRVICRIAGLISVMQNGEKKGYRGSLALSAMKRGYGGSHAPTKVAPAKVAPGQRREATGAIAVAPKPSPKAGYCRRCCWRKLLSRATFDDPTFVGYCGSPVLAV